MATKILKHKKKKVSTKREPVEAERKVVLVGTYKGKQLDSWPNYYNYPLYENDKFNVEACGAVNELWLFNGTKNQRSYVVEIVGIKTREELVSKYGYKVRGKTHGDGRYLLFKLIDELYEPSTGFADDVIIRTRDFATSKVVQKQLKKYLESPECRDDSIGRFLPTILTTIPQKALRVCDNAFQTDFFDELMPLAAKALSVDGKKLRLATVFSGIGAIEQALARTHVSHEIVFACDNGDQTPFVCDAVEWQECVDTFRKLCVTINKLKPLTESQKISAEMIRSQRDTIQGLLDGAPAMSKRPERELKDRVQMLHEAVGFYKFRVDWESEKDWAKRKQLVDMLYRPLLSRNKVRISYMENYPVTDDRFHWNVTFLEGAPYKNEVDLFVGGSPCQSFSLVGKQMGLSDTRGTLFYEYARLVSEIRPKCFIYENVRALLSNDSGRTWETISKVFTDLGYDWKHQVLNSKDYGIPQNRERVFVVGFRKDLGIGDKFQFPEPRKLQTTMQDYLLDVVPGKYYLPEKGVRFICSYCGNGHLVEQDTVDAFDVFEYFKDCFHHHTGRYPSQRQIFKFVALGHCLVVSRSLCHEWFCSAA